MAIGRRAVLTGLPLVGFGGLTAAFWLGRNRDAGAAPGAIDHPMPAFDLPPLPGNDTGFGSADVLGQVALVNIWGAWCGSCRDEHPLLVRLSGQMDVPIFGIDIRDAPGAGKLYLNENGNPFAATGDDRDGRVGRSFGITGVPETFIVDAEGRLRYRHIGALTQDAWETALLPVLSRLQEAA